MERSSATLPLLCNSDVAWRRGEAALWIGAARDMVRSLPHREPKPMPEATTAQAVELLDLMLEHFVDDGHWTRGRYDDGNGGLCLVGALLRLSRKHRLPRAPAIALLQDAMPRPGLRLCSSTTPVAGASPSCVPSSSRPAVSPTIMRSKSGWPMWQGCGCSLRSRKNDPRRRRISRIRRRTHRSSPNASPPSDRTRLSRVVAPREPTVRIRLLQRPDSPRTIGSTGDLWRE
jgi:hypothetical protein